MKCTPTENEIVDAGTDVKQSRLSNPILLQSDVDWPKLDIEYHVAVGHGQHRAWCDACIRARGIAEDVRNGSAACCDGVRQVEA